MAPLEGAVLPKGSLILVTGVNGYVGSHVADQFLRFGYKVRGTVRDTEKSAWIDTYFDQKYGAGNFELVGVEDLSNPDALKEVLGGCSGLAAVASVLTFDSDPNLVITPSVALTKASLEAAAATPSVKRFVQTSSSSAAPFGIVDTKVDVHPDDYNTKAVEDAWAPPPYEEHRKLSTYMASKVLQEQAMWKFMQERKPGFIANSVLPDFVNGKILSIKDQGYPSSIAVLKALWDGDLTHPSMLPPQYEIDAEDTAMLHVAAMLHPDAQGERIFGFAYPRNLTSTIHYLRELYPDKQFPDPPENEGEDLVNILARPRAEQLLKWVKGSGWTDQKQSIKNCCDLFPSL